MTGTFWTNWQLCVDPEDTVVVVGDFTLGEALSEETWDRVGPGQGGARPLEGGGRRQSRHHRPRLP